MRGQKQGRAKERANQTKKKKSQDQGTVEATKSEKNK